MFEVKRANLIRQIALGALCIGLTGCATLNPVVNVTSLGEANPSRDEEIAERFEEATSDDEPVDASVRVLVDTVPEGLTYADGQLSVDEGYAHEVVAHFEMTTDGGFLNFPTFWFTASFFDYEATWRRGLCWWQVPLEWVSLGFWSVVPTSYPCHPTIFRSKAAWVDSVKALAQAAGASSAIMSYIDADQKEARGTVGFLIKLDPKVLVGRFKTRPMELKPAGAEK